MSNSFGRRRTDRLRERCLDDLIARQQMVAILRNMPLPPRSRLLLEAYDDAEATMEDALNALALEGLE